MYYFAYGVVALNYSKNPLYRNMKLISSEAWVYGRLYDTGLGFPAMTEGESKVHGKLLQIDEEQLSALASLAANFDELNEPFRFTLHSLPVYTPLSAYEALVFVYEDAEGLPPIEDGIWR
ncbi:gamma-glutamylcyclotransferase [Paenibacillus filicis]|uniref:Gamma-glutamylcyclotransferase n=1 Tax=Paenibacillus gyeongsangnamensis TaxID=3388067 RepID=A0ABT4Q7B1_9BACL|nr:gamma-glutamylcyclotransferase [Paenibacillus filicis]MCZ8512754.1 gamma-glutamylcyclotransferase [Paenibacillus filicis]